MQCVYSVVLFGPPHRGLEIQALEQLTRGTERHGVITDLEKGSTLLRELNEKFPSVSRNLKIITCFELQATPTIRRRLDDPESWERTGPSKIMVDRNSACLYSANESRIAIDKNHSRIAKLSRADEAYQRLKTIFEDDISIAQATIQSRLNRVNVVKAVKRICDVIMPLVGFLNHLDQRGSGYDMTVLERMSSFLNQIHHSLSADVLSLTWINPISFSRLMENISDALYAFEAYILLYKDISKLYQQFVAGDSLSQSHEASCATFAKNIQKSDRFASQLRPPRIARLIKNSSSFLERLCRLLWLALLNLGSINDLEYPESIPLLDETGISNSARQQIRVHLTTLKGQSAAPVAGHLQEAVLLLAPRIQNFVPHGSTECFPVVVEERSYDIDDHTARDPAALNALKLKLRNRMEQLTIVLQHLTPGSGNAISPLTPPSPSVCTLPCLGYQETAKPGKFLILFRVPDFVERFGTVKSFSTLYARLNSEGYRPSLQERFRLAKAICSAILHLHCWGWVHKDIRPENIILISHPDEPAIDSGEAKENSPIAYLGGFEVARPENDFSDITKTLELRKNIYRHPERQQTPLRPFAKTDDLYAIGVILLEIGLRKTVNTIFISKMIAMLEKTGHTYHPDAIANKIKRLAAADLPQNMGNRYAEVVRKCLTGDFGVIYDDDAKSELSIAFQDTVFDVLEQGCQL